MAGPLCPSSPTLPKFPEQEGHQREVDPPILPPAVRHAGLLFSAPRVRAATLQVGLASLLPPRALQLPPPRLDTAPFCVPRAVGGTPRFSCSIAPCPLHHVPLAPTRFCASLQGSRLPVLNLSSGTVSALACLPIVFPRGVRTLLVRLSCRYVAPLSLAHPSKSDSWEIEGSHDRVSQDTGDFGFSLR